MTGTIKAIAWELNCDMWIWTVGGNIGIKNIVVNLEYGSIYIYMEYDSSFNTDIKDYLTSL